MALSVPLSRFTLRVGAGSAIFVRPHYAPVDMSPIYPLTTKAWVALSLVAGLLVFFAIFAGEVLIPVAAFCTAAIAAFDSSHISLRRYKTGISYGPVGLFVICALIWPFAIIWYFIVRVRIARGTMPLRDEFKHSHVA